MNNYGNCADDYCPISLSASVVSGTGKIRINNEDNYYFNGCIKEEESQKSDGILSLYGVGSAIFGVFDGLGGEEKGELASYLCAKTLKAIIIDNEINKGEDILDFYIHANKAVVEESRKKRLRVCGSTAVISLIKKSKAYISNIGDSKCFLVRNGDIVQLSEDHTDEQFMLLNGITGRKPRLTQCIGMDEEYGQIDPSQLNIDLCNGDRLILCSDGVTDMVSTDYLCMVASQHNCTKAVEEIEKAVLKNGARDNYTIIVVEIESE